MAQITLNSSGVASSGSLLLQTNGTTTQATVDTSGNLGLGVTPSAWASGGKALELPNGSSLFTYTNTSQVILTSNAYFNGTNWIYKATNAAANYEQGVGKHIWYNAPSGTAGNAITFTQAMTLDASGNLGVGTTSPACRVNIYATVPEIRLQNPTTGTGVTGLTVQQSGADSYVWNYSNGFLSLGTNNTERARIDSSGNLLVGTTDSGAGTGAGFKFKPAGNGASAPLFNIVTANSSNSSSSVQLYSTGAGAYRFYIGDGGTVYATSTSISAISDATLKENVRDLETGLNEVMALRPRRFDWINGDAQNVSGFVAQEVEAVLPELVTDYVYNIDEEGNNIVKKSLKMGDILPTLVKAIQEQQAIITQLQADVAALKGQA